METPTIVCLCGSTRFVDAFEEHNLKETLKGNIVLSVGSHRKSDSELMITEEQKVGLDALHKKKIELCDEVLVLNVDGYVGSSTTSEICYANKLNKKIRWLSNELQNSTSNSTS